MAANRRRIATSTSSWRDSPDKKAGIPLRVDTRGKGEWYAWQRTVISWQGEKTLGKAWQPQQGVESGRPESLALLIKGHSSDSFAE
jgi:hypothetical protein